MLRCLLSASLLAVSAGFSWGTPIPQGSEDAAAEERAVALVKRMGGEVTRDEKVPGRPVVRVHLSGWQLGVTVTTETRKGNEVVREHLGTQLFMGEERKLTGLGIRD